MKGLSLASARFLWLFCAMRILLLFGICWAPLALLCAQSASNSANDSSVVQVYWEPGLKSQYMQWHETRKNEKTKGFRVQLVSLNGADAREELHRMRKQFCRYIPTGPFTKNGKLQIGNSGWAILRPHWTQPCFVNKLKGCFLRPMW